MINNKEPFEFSYTKPSLDWYETVNVKIEWDKYYYFKLQYRFGPSVWLIGTNPVDEPEYHFKEEEIGEITGINVKRFIEWAKKDNGSKLVGVNAICGSFDIIKEIQKLIT